MQYVLALVALYVGLAHSFSWDFVVTSGSQIEFYFNGRHTRSDKIASGDIKLITYDAVGNRMFFVDSENKNTAIFSYDITTKKVESLVPKNTSESIKGIAFDPVEELLFWGTKESKIYSFSLKTGFENNVYGNLIIQIPAENHILPSLTPAVDSCRGYIYWSAEWSPFNIQPTIGRARFDGSDREDLIDSDLENPKNFIIDQQSQKMYWTDTRWATKEDDRQFFIESADLNGKNRTKLYGKTGIYQTNTLAVLNDSIYWVRLYGTTVYQLSKNPLIHATPKEISIDVRRPLVLIATNYKIDDQIPQIQECERLKRLLPNNSVTDDNVSLNISADVSLFGVHGKKVSGKSQCQCTHGYTGEKCDVSVCQNYCLQGDCFVSAEEQPTCRCNAGYSGERCQVNDCQGYCLNDGICSLNEKSKPVCQCKGYYEGKRCDVSTFLNKCFLKVVSMVWGVYTDVQAILDKEVKSTCASTAV